MQKSLHNSDALGDKPSPARMYDYFLGGFHNFEIDRQAAEQIIALNPEMPLVAQVNRAFLRRVINFLSKQGIDQFLDIGSGLPTVGNVHEIAQRLNPAARVVYVDIDPVAVRYSESILENAANATVIQADVRQPKQIFAHPHTRDLLDFNRPIAILLVALLHFVTDDEEALGVVQALCDAVPPGSYIAISHATHEDIPPEVYERGKQIYARSTNPMVMRLYDQIVPFFKGIELIEPGIVYVPLWHPEETDDLFLDQPARSISYAGVGRKV